LPWAYSKAFKDDAKQKYQCRVSVQRSAHFDSPSSYLFSVESADAVPIAEIKGWVFIGVCMGYARRMKKLTTVASKGLTSKFSASTMQTLTCTYVLVDKK
jgi:hypothetical protein